MKTSPTANEDQEKLWSWPRRKQRGRDNRVQYNLHAWHALTKFQTLSQADCAPLPFPQIKKKRNAHAEEKNKEKQDKISHAEMPKTKQKSRIKTK